jgi:DNA-binding NarL/FixJ family response regulator
MSTTRVLIVDDHPFFRSGLANWLNQQDDLTSCGEAGSMEATRGAVEVLRPDVVLLDLRLGDEDGLELLRELSENHPGIRVVVVSQSDEQTFAHRALKAGARGYIMKSEATDTVLEAIQTVLRGEVYLSRSISARILHKLFPDPASSSPDLARLTDRELQVFQLLGSGNSTREIAERLKISPKTVESHREHLKDKLCLPDGVALTRVATIWVEKGRFELP